MIVDCALYENGRRRPGKLPLERAGQVECGPGDFVWVGLVEPTEAEFETVAREFDLHELAVEDAIKAHQRPKLERYGETLLIVVKTARYIDPREVIEVGELLVFVNPDFIVTVRHGEGDLGPVRERLDSRPDLAEHGVGMVLYAILDHVVDGYEAAAEGVDVDVQEVERQVFSEDRDNPAERIYKLEREVLDFQGAVAPLARLRGMRGRSSSFGLGAEPPPLGWGLLAVAAVIAASTVLIYPLAEVAPVVSLGVVYLPGVLLISTVWGWRLGLLTAVASALAFNFFHIPPTGRFTVAADRDGVALVAFAIVAVASSALAELARARAAEAERGREEADRLLSELRAAEAERERMEAAEIEAEALRRSDELKTSLLRSVSHDLRTPLTSIIAAGAALDSPSASPAERHELSQAVITEGQRLSRLVENLLDVSRLESGNARPRREPVDLAGVLEAARSAVGAGPEQVKLALDAELPALDADAAQLERAFANLLENGVRHGQGRPVLVRSRTSGGRLVVRVVDQGPGIPEPQRALLFEPFYRREDGSGGGVGLGLAIARGFVEANGGEIAVESVPGQGSTFVVSFPLEGER